MKLVCEHLYNQYIITVIAFRKFWNNYQKYSVTVNLVLLKFYIAVETVVFKIIVGAFTIMYK